MDFGSIKYMGQVRMVPVKKDEDEGQQGTPTGPVPNKE